MSDEFIDEFGIVGPPDRCIARLQELKDVGLDKVMISGQLKDAGTKESIASQKLFEVEVLGGLI